ncbi:MAG TPA: carbohydrate ABC transporter substrate-binding protein [Candidatus Pullichristensenella stercorigallinarum]|uniref:Carbohydrate ABC transporter substrate-binding protein n=1 Tax=Candidatus Pullichristensenella stercorigallinarum TaxID=2840909 RepID=A0A9D1CV27_9FIRM|nr:carbohydrate ABC transporter substrate-binding protein [Candidatus Pullichristensenella stercorigallinarum]
MKKLLLMLLALALMLTPFTALAAEKVTEYDAAALIEDTAAEGSVNVYHWWTAGGEKDAIESVISGFQAAYPSSQAKSNAIPGGAGGAMVMKVKVLQQAGKSPESFQAHPGEEIQPYLDADMLLDLSAVWEYAGLEERVLPGIADLCQTEDGKYYIVPVGVHKTNTIFYNKHMFEEYGIELTDEENITWDEFWAICDQLQAALPEGKYAVDLGDRKGWAAAQVFESIMMGVDPQIYENFINGKATQEEVQSVLDVFAKLMTYVAPDHAAREWYETAGRMVAGDYAMQIMGTWMQPLLTSMGWVYGEDYGVFNMPGTEGYYGLCVDAFVVPNDSANVEGGVRWAYMVADPDVQIAFSTVKESVSPYADTPDSTYNELTMRFKEELLAEGTITYPSFTHGTALPWAASTDLQTRITDFSTSTDPDTARYAKMITEALNEAGVEGEWDIVP